MRYFIFLSFLFLFSCENQQKIISEEKRMEKNLHINYSVQIPKNPKIKTRKLDQIDFLECFFELKMKFPDYTQYIAYDKSIFSAPLSEIYSEYHSGQPAYQPTLLSLTDVSGTQTIAKIGFFKPVDDNFSSTSIVFNIMIIEGKDGFKLTNMLNYNTRNWQNRISGKINYYAHPDHEFNENKIRKMQEFNQRMGNLFQTNPFSFFYYVSPDVKTSMQARGYDFQYSMFLSDQTGGTAFPWDKIIFSGNASEYHPHELVHLYLYEYYPDVHPFIKEGVAVYFGGSKGLPFEKHIQVLKEHLEKNEVDILEKLHHGRAYTINEKTSLWYAMGALLCDLSMRKYGKKGLWQLLNSGKTEKELHDSLEKLFGIKMENFKDFIQKELQYYE